jgi:hypothetical protein
MSYVGVGSQDQVLTLDAGTQKWQDPAVAVGGTGVLGVTVAEFIPADFPSIVAALAANNTILNVIGDVNEVATINVPSSGLSITIFNASDVNLGTQNFVWTDNSNLDIRGNGFVSYGYASPTEIFDHSGFNLGRVTVDGITLNNNSSAPATLTDGVDGRFSNCVFTGGVLLDGTRNQIDSSDITGDLEIAATSVNGKISSCQVDGSLTDNGTATVISDTDNY